MTSVDLIDHPDLVALFQFEFFRTAARDYAFDQIVSNLHDDVGHNVADVNLFNLAGELVSSLKVPCPFVANNCEGSCM